MRLFIMITVSLLAACSTTVTGPVTGKQYNLDIGCTENMQDYQREREAITGEQAESPEPEVKIDCPSVPKPQP